MFTAHFRASMEGILSTHCLPPKLTCLNLQILEVNLGDLVCLSFAYDRRKYAMQPTTFSLYDPVHLPKTQIVIQIRAFAKYSTSSCGLIFHHVDSEELDRIWWTPYLRWVLAGRTCNFVECVIYWFIINI